MTTRCPFSDPQDPVPRVSKIRGQDPRGWHGRSINCWRRRRRHRNWMCCGRCLRCCQRRCWRNGPQGGWKGIA
ncbi:hypothetical protein C1708_28360 [Streptomyces sp. DH-12]|nr:hypothetical protein C1708_28360 [Streptomyces sp. DH-12]